VKSRLRTADIHGWFSVGPFYEVSGSELSLADSYPYQTMVITIQLDFYSTSTRLQFDRATPIRRLRCVWASALRPKSIIGQCNSGWQVSDHRCVTSLWPWWPLISSRTAVESWL